MSSVSKTSIVSWTRYQWTWGWSTEREDLGCARLACTAKHIKLLTFLELCSYYRRFVRNFSDVAAPLHQLQEKDVPFCWTEDQEVTFIRLKEALTTAPVIGTPRKKTVYSSSTLTRHRLDFEPFFHKNRAGAKSLSPMHQWSRLLNRCKLELKLTWT